MLCFDAAAAAAAIEADTVAFVAAAAAVEAGEAGGRMRASEKMPWFRIVYDGVRRLILTRLLKLSTCERVDCASSEFVSATAAPAAVVP